MKLKIKRLAHAADVPPPSYASDGAAGLDLSAAVGEPLTLAPGARAVVPTGFAIELPQGFEAQVRGRSGLAAKHGIGLVNAPGTIDCDYRGEIGVILINHGSEAFIVTRGMRIAQLVVAPVTRVTIEESQGLDATRRGEDGFGSTGVAARG
jgi:dUTP pyrophosphatase